jgi:amino acid adenylation domain-containing protein
MVDDIHSQPADGSQDTEVYSVFERGLVLHRDRIAIVHGTAQHRYADLERMIDAFARALRDHGCTPRTRVCLAVGHRAELVAAVLAVLKLGATYVPLDRRAPVERAKFIAEDSGATLLVYDPDCAGLAAALGVRALCTAEIVPSDERIPRARVGAADLAYILYTSGSTATPKGVGISHENLLSYVAWARDTYFRSACDRIALYTTLAFDFTVTCIFPPLIAGASIVIYDGISNPLVIQDIVNDPLVNVLKITPSYLHVLSLILDDHAHLRRLIVGGEDLKVSLAARVHAQLHGRAEIINEYGPTEATVGCVVHRFDPATDTESSVAIGRPIPGMRAYVLADDGEWIEDGREGELCIAGAGVAPGYLNLEARSREVFVADPRVPGARMYRTGDIVRRRADGDLMFVGRRDDQVKIRGNRVGLSEVTAAMLAHPRITSAYATAVPEHGTNALVAVVTGERGLTEDDVVADLNARLPPYMVPSIVKVVDQLPLTPNQKVDRTEVLAVLGKRRG